MIEGIIVFFFAAADPVGFRNEELYDTVEACEDDAEALGEAYAASFGAVAWGYTCEPVGINA